MWARWVTGWRVRMEYDRLIHLRLPLKIAIDIWGG